jgi:diketogulonate reductase-like aldo/keto reductase
MSVLKEMYTLSNGVEIPKLGFGTWQIPNEEAYEATLAAFRVGYRHIDTAQAYRNEKAIGEALKASGLKRDEYFITSKLPAQIKGYQEAHDAFKRTMQDLQLDVLDLYLIHAPWPWDQIGKDCTQGNIDSWKAMVELYQAGKIRSIGVSNFSPKDMQAVIDATGFVPHVNQIRYYIGDVQDETVGFCKEHKILVEAYSPLATGRILEHPELISISRELNVSVAQVCIRYCLEKGTLPLPKTTKETRMVENSAVDFKLSDEHLSRLDALKNLDGRHR